MSHENLDLDAIVSHIRPVSRDWMEKAGIRTESLIMPTRALGRIHDMAERLCAIQKTLSPSVQRKAVIIMAGDHGVARDGVSAYPQEVTGAMVRAFLAGGAGVNAFCRQTGTEAWVVDMGIASDIDPATVPGAERFFVEKHGRGTENFTLGPAMDRKTAVSAVLTGFRYAEKAFSQGIDILVTGDMGIGNTTPSSAIGAVLTKNAPGIMTGAGTGVKGEALSRKVAAIEKAIALNRPDPVDGIDVLAKVGGFEIGGIAGLVLAGAFHGRPVVVDGLISSAGALIAHALCPTVTDYLFAGHRSEEPGHGLMLSHLGLSPILDLGMRLGEGSGAVLALCVLEGACRVMREVLTFDEAGVPGKA